MEITNSYKKYVDLKGNCVIVRDRPRELIFTINVDSYIRITKHNIYLYRKKKDGIYFDNTITGTYKSCIPILETPASLVSTIDFNFVKEYIIPNKCRMNSTKYLEIDIFGSVLYTDIYGYANFR